MMMQSIMHGYSSICLKWLISNWSLTIINLLYIYTYIPWPSSVILRCTLVSWSQLINGAVQTNEVLGAQEDPFEGTLATQVAPQSVPRCTHEGGGYGKGALKWWKLRRCSGLIGGSFLTNFLHHEVSRFESFFLSRVFDGPTFFCRCGRQTWRTLLQEFFLKLHFLVVLADFIVPPLSSRAHPTLAYAWAPFHLHYRCLAAWVNWSLYIPRDFLIAPMDCVAPWQLLATLDTLPM